jgi:hypothetical protein
MKILVFSPEAALRPFWSAMALIAHSLEARGHDVILTSCAGAFRRCVAKLSHPEIDAEADGHICYECRRHLTKQSARIRVPLLPIECHQEVGMDARIDALLDSWPGDLIDFVYDDEKLGQIAAYDLFLAFKIRPGIPLTPAATAFLHDGLHTVVKTYIMAKWLIAERKIDRVLVNGQYGPNMAVFRAAHRAGAKARIMALSSHLVVDRRYLWFTTRGTLDHYFGLSRDWARWSRVPLPAESVAMGGAEMKARFLSNSVHVYSPGKDFAAGDITTRLGLRRERKTIVVFTSSLDELHAQYALEAALDLNFPRPALLFRDQIAWFEHMMQFAAGREDLQFCIRIHPREAPNRRDGVRSVHLEQLEAVLAAAPGNIRVIWPQDPVSSYDLLDIADMVMTSWTNMALESARLGIPVLSPFQSMVGYPVGDFITMPSEEAAYRRALDAMVTAPADLFNVRQAFRWYHLSRMAASVPVGDAFPDPELEAPFTAKVLDRIDEIERILDDDTPIERRRLAAALEIEASAANWAEEEAAVKAELSKALVYFMAGEWPDGAIDLYRDEGPDHPESAVLSSGDRHCRLTWRGRTFERDSRLVERLGWVLAS